MKIFRQKHETNKKEKFIINATIVECSQAISSGLNKSVDAFVPVDAGGRAPNKIIFYLR